MNKLTFLILKWYFNIRFRHYITCKVSGIEVHFYWKFHNIKVTKGEVFCNIRYYDKDESHITIQLSKYLREAILYRIRRNKNN